MSKSKDREYRQCSLCGFRSRSSTKLHKKTIGTCPKCHHRTYIKYTYFGINPYAK